MRYSGPAEAHNKKKLSNTVFNLDLKCPQIASKVKAGQFIQLKLVDSGNCLWPRPFSVHRIKDDTITITIKICGKVTRLISELKPKDTVNITGPLGNSFSMPSDDKSVFFVAGGVGLPPLHLMCETLLKDGCPPDKIHFFSGAKSSDELFADDEIKQLGVNYIISTDDGSAGIKGFIIDPLAVELAKIRTGGNDESPVIYSCGPSAMLKKVAELAYGLECYLSLEQLMPCGWGVCNGCAVKVKTMNKTITEDERGFRLARVCKEGPIFAASEIIWE